VPENLNKDWLRALQEYIKPATLKNLKPDQLIFLLSRFTLKDQNLVKWITAPQVSQLLPGIWASQMVLGMEFLGILAANGVNVKELPEFSELSSVGFEKSVDAIAAMMNDKDFCYLLFFLKGLRAYNPFEAERIVTGWDILEPLCDTLAEALGSQQTQIGRSMMREMHAWISALLSETILMDIDQVTQYLREHGTDDNSDYEKIIT